MLTGEITVGVMQLIHQHLNSFTALVTVVKTWGNDEENRVKLVAGMRLKDIDTFKQEREKIKMFVNLCQYVCNGKYFIYQFCLFE